MNKDRSDALYYSIQSYIKELGNRKPDPFCPELLNELINYNPYKQKSIMKKYTIEEMQKMDNPPWIKCININQAKKLGHYCFITVHDLQYFNFYNSFEDNKVVYIYIRKKNNTSGGWVNNIDYVIRTGTEIIDFSQVIFPKDQQNNNNNNDNMKEEYKVDKDFILQAHKAACSEWKGKLEDKFPELFPEGPIGIEGPIQINTSDTKFLYIGNVYAERSLNNKCLIVGDGYRVEVKIHPTSGRQQLVFYKKKN